LPRFRRKADASTRSRIPAGGHDQYPVICGGAFAGLEKILMNRTHRSGIGLLAEVREQNARPHAMTCSTTPNLKDLIKYGLIPEFVGRAAGGRDLGRARRRGV